MKNLPKKYWEAIIWIASFDDNDWLADYFGIPNVTLTMVSELFKVKIEDATEHLRMACLRIKEIR